MSVIIIAHNYGQVLEICDRVNLLQHGEITFDKRSADTSVAELNDIVVAEYRRALAERHRQLAEGGRRRADRRHGRRPAQPSAPPGLRPSPPRRAEHFTRSIVNVNGRLTRA